MERGDRKRDDLFLTPGTKVRLDSLVNDDGSITAEFGVVVHCWFDDEAGMYDCYVAFFGGCIPEGKPEEKPYVLRYSATSLVVLE